MTEFLREPAHLRAAESKVTGPLRVWSETAEAAPLIEALRREREVEELADLPEPAGIATGAEAAETLLLCLSPGGALAQAMARQTLPAQALEEWQSQARRLLALNRRNRRRVRILFLDAAARRPEAAAGLFGAALADWNPEPAREDTPAQAGDDAVLRLLAQSLIATDAEARALAAELDAVSLLPAAEDAATEAEAAFHAWQAAGAAKRQAVEVAALQAAANDRNAALQAALEQVLEQAGAEAERTQADLDAQAARADALAAEMEAARAEAGARIEELLAELEASRAETGTTREEVDLLQAQTRLMRSELDMVAREKLQLEQRLAQVSQGLESFRAQAEEREAELGTLRGRAADKDRGLEAAGREMQALAARGAALEARAAALEARLRQVENSRSMRLTRPLRRMTSLLRGRGRT